jgi:hypothetical protein
MIYILTYIFTGLLIGIFVVDMNKLLDAHFFINLGAISPQKFVMRYKAWSQFLIFLIPHLMFVFLLLIIFYSKIVNLIRTSRIK